MAHIHSIYDSDAHFVINAATRTMRNASTSKTSVIQHDHNSERFTFEIPRYIEGHDMSTCNAVEVHFLNIETNTKVQNAGMYVVDDLQISPEDDQVVVCSWLISHEATRLVGSLNFLIRFACVTDTIVDYAWNTAVYTGISVSSGIYNGDAILEIYSDVIREWEKSIYNKCDEMLDFINGESVELGEKERVTYMFTVGEDSESDFIDETDGAVFTEAGGYRYHNQDAYTIYKFPLAADGRNSNIITGALFHAHTAQQTLLEFSTDKVNWEWFVDNGEYQIGQQYYYDLAKYGNIKGAEYLYIRISDSSTEDGSGGSILSDVPVSLEIIYGEPNPNALPPVNGDDDGKFLRVIDGRWCAVAGEAATSRVYTYTFKPGDASEEKYIHELGQKAGTSTNNGNYRYMDRDNYIIYKYHIANSCQVRRLFFTAVFSGKVYLEVSDDGDNWKVLHDCGTERIVKDTKLTFELTDYVNMLRWDDIYIRLSNSDPDKTTGFGGAIACANNVELRTERCEVMLMSATPQLSNGDKVRY